MNSHTKNMLTSLEETAIEKLLTSKQIEEVPPVIEEKKEDNIDPFSKQILESLAPKQEKTEKQADRHTCESCGIVTNTRIFEQQEGKCPKCGKEMTDLLHEIDMSEKRFNCPKCQSSYKYTRINECDCSVCHSRMLLHTPMPKIDHQKRSNIPTE